MAHITILTQLRDTKSLQPQQFSHLCTHEHTLGNNCANTHTVRVSTACPTEGVRVMSQQRYTHHLYSYRTDATYSVNTHSPPPPLRSLTPSIHPSLFLPPPPLLFSLVTVLSLTICILLLRVTHWLHTGDFAHTHRHTHAHTHTQRLQRMSKCPFNTRGY